LLGKRVRQVAGTGEITEIRMIVRMTGIEIVIAETGGTMVIIGTGGLSAQEPGVGIIDPRG